MTVSRDEPDPPEGRGDRPDGRHGDPARSGASSAFRRPVPAGAAVLNGAGELTGFLQVSEWGLIETPVYLTSTMAVGRVFDGAVAAACAADAAVGVDDVVIPVVGECDDSWLNDARTVQVEAADAGRALGRAAGGVVAQGCVGAGTGMIALGWKGGDRLLEPRSFPRSTRRSACSCSRTSAPRATCASTACPSSRRVGDGIDPRPPAGSCIAIVATDAPLRPAQLERLARRAGLGLARTGSVAHHGSGEIFLAFSTAAADRDERRSRVDRATVPDALLDPLFARRRRGDRGGRRSTPSGPPSTPTGREGRVVRALPHEPVLELLRRHGRL